jgi:hypothetical protein
MAWAVLGRSIEATRVQRNGQKTQNRWLKPAALKKALKNGL